MDAPMPEALHPDGKAVAGHHHVVEMGLSLVVVTCEWYHDFVDPGLTGQMYNAAFDAAFAALLRDEGASEVAVQ